jgi:hypothetical protein
VSPAPDPDDDSDLEAPEACDPPQIEVEISEPLVLNELYGPNGGVIAYLVDRRQIPFGFQPGGT